MNNNPILSIIILNYNTQFWLKNCLNSLKQHYLSQTQHEVEVIVVDNNSNDDSVKMLRREFRFVQVIALSENRGFAAGNNEGLRVAKGKYCMLLNSDTELTPASTLDELLEVMETDQSWGVITPRVELVDGSIDPACHRGEPSPWASFCYFSGLESLFPQSKLFAEYHLGYKDERTIHPIDACTGAAMIVRASALKKVGLLDERFFMYAEDLDWCRRFREAGYQVIYYPLVSLIHHKHKSGLQSSNTRLKKQTSSHFYEAMLKYFDKYYQEKYPKPLRRVLIKLYQRYKGAL